MRCTKKACCGLAKAATSPSGRVHSSLAHQPCSVPIGREILSPNEHSKKSVRRHEWEVAMVYNFETLKVEIEDGVKF